MKAEIATFPYGQPDGLPVLRLDFDGAPWSTADADAATKRNAARGLWGIWLDGLASWECAELDVWIAEQENVVALRKLGALDWPSSPVSTVLDVSEAMRHATDIDALADFVATKSTCQPLVHDIIAVIAPDQRAPFSAALDLLTDFSQPQGQGYIYAPATHLHWPLMLRAISQCGSQWSLRASH